MPPIASKIAFALVLAAMHLAALSLDYVISNNWLLNPKITFPFCLAIFHCDIALLCLWISRRPRFPAISVALLIIVACLTAAAIIYSWQDPSAAWVNSSKVFTESLQGQCVITALLNLPILAVTAWLVARPQPRDWHWLAYAALLLASVLNSWLSSTTNDYVTNRSQAWWLGLHVHVFYHTLFAWILSLTAITLCAWVISSTKGSRSLGLMILALITARITLAASGTVIFWCMRYVNRYGGGWFGGFIINGPSPEEALAMDFHTPLLAILFGVVIAPFCILYNRAAEPTVTPFAPLRQSLLAAVDRRHRFWRLTAFALFISMLNLLSGLSLHLLGVNRSDVHGEQGILVELLFLAPLGLWAAQTGASALFLQAKIWNIWKRLLVVLAWAELSMLGFWGQVALSSSIKWNPSDYVGEVLHVFCGAAILAAAGNAIGYLRGEAVGCPELVPAENQPIKSKRFSLSLADIICLVTTSAALVYPFSVIFTLEHWRSPLQTALHFLVSAVWPLAAGAFSYFLLRAWVSKNTPHAWTLAAASICLLICCGFDYPALHVIGVERFFGVRPSLRFTALPGLLVGLSVAAIGLARCNFVVDHKSFFAKPKAKIAARETPESPTTPRFLGVTTVPAASQPKSPWD